VDDIKSSLAKLSFSFAPMLFSDLRAELDCATPNGRASHTGPSPTGGVAVGMGNLSLEDQGAALPGTPIVNSRFGPTPKVYFPVAVKGVEEMFLAVIGQDLSFYLHTSCPTASHREARCFQFTEGDSVLSRKAKDVVFCEPTLRFRRMDDDLLMNWNTNPRSLDQWSEAFLAYRRCLEALPDDGDACVTAAMISAKRKFHRQAQEVRTPSKVLFTDLDEDSDGFESVTFLPPLSPFKASLDISSPALADRDKELARHVRLAEESLATATHNLIR
jgi:hypothetical protein